MAFAFPNKGKGESSNSLKTEHDLHIWEDNTIRNNISSFWTDHTYKTGDDRIFEADFEFTELLDVYKNDTKLKKWRDYNVYSTQSVIIYDNITLNDGDLIELRYNHFIVTPE